MPKYEIEWAGFDSEKLAQLLDESWEPFAVIANQTGGFVIWLRREQSEYGDVN